MVELLLYPVLKLSTVQDRLPSLRLYPLPTVVRDTEAPLTFSCIAYATYPEESLLKQASIVLESAKVLVRDTPVQVWAPKVTTTFAARAEKDFSYTLSEKLEIPPVLQSSATGLHLRSGAQVLECVLPNGLNELGNPNSINVQFSYQMNGAAKQTGTNIPIIIEALPPLGEFELLEESASSSAMPLLNSTGQDAAKVLLLGGQTWIPGDGHVHTDWSDGGFSLRHRMGQARQNAFGWLAYADHTQKLKSPLTGAEGQRAWNEYRAVVRRQQTPLTQSFAALEYSTITPPNRKALRFENLVCLIAGADAHMLSYGQSRFVPNPPEDQMTVEKFNGESYFKRLIRGEQATVVIAHPMGAPPARAYPWFADGGRAHAQWDDIPSWLPTEFKNKPFGLEIMSASELEANPKLLGRWDSLLRRRLRVFPTAGSDCHQQAEALGDLFAFGKCFTYSVVSDSDPYLLGRTVASSGPFVAVSSKGRQSGSEVRLSLTEPLNVTVHFIESTHQGRSVELKRFGVTYGDTTGSAGRYAIPSIRRSNGYVTGSVVLDPKLALSAIYVRAWAEDSRGRWAYSAPIYIDRS